MESDDSEDKKKKSRRARREKGNFEDVNKCMSCKAEVKEKERCLSELVSLKERKFIFRRQSVSRKTEMKKCHLQFLF
jgi:hypothetical protein